MQLAPTPDGTALEFSLQCRSSRTSTRGAKHAVTIHPDWTVTTPHDFETERIAMAFGGYTSCLDLVDHTIPAFRGALGILTRRERHGVRWESGDGWRLPLEQQAEHCCRAYRFASVESAARHSRTASHLARLHDLPQWQLGALMKAAQLAWGEWEGDAPSAAGVVDLVREVGGVDELWIAGVHPRELPALASAAVAVGGPLPVSYFLGMTYGNGDAEWMRQVLRFRPDPDTAAWLSWVDHPTKAASASNWAKWLSFGLPRADTLTAIDANLSADHVCAIAATLGWSEPITAKFVVAWAKADCYPTVAQFELLARSGVQYSRPSRSTVDLLVSEMERTLMIGVPVSRLSDRTSLGVLLALLGTRREVLHAIENGLDDFADLDRYQHAKLVGRTK
jgi:hypothetical protein